MIDFAQCFGTIHVNGTLEVMHVNEAVYLVVQHKVSAMTAIRRNLHRNGNACSSAASPVCVKLDTVTVQTMVGVYDIALRTNGGNHDPMFESHLSPLAYGQWSKYMGVLFLVQRFHRVSPPDCIFLRIFEETMACSSKRICRRD